MERKNMSFHNDNELETLPQRVWRIRKFYDAISSFLIRTETGLILGLFQRIVAIVSLFMMIYPVFIFIRALKSQILLLSPALIFMFFGGVVGLFMLRIQNKNEL